MRPSILFRWGSFAYRNRWKVVIGWVAALVIMGVLSGMFAGEFSDEFSNPGSDSQLAYDLLAERFPSQAGDSAQIVFQSEAGIADPAVQAEIQTVLDAALASSPHAVAVADSPITNPTNIGASGNIGYATILFDALAQDIELVELEKWVADVDALNSDTLQIELGGNIVAFAETEQPGGETFIALAAAAVVLMIAFGSLIAMGLPIVTAATGLGFGFMCMNLVTNWLDVPTFTTFIVAMIGLGVGVDYALFIVTRFREGLHSGLSVEKSVGQAMDTSGRAVLFAGIVVVIALAGLTAIGLPFITAYSVAACLGVSFVIVSAITLLPALLGLAGHKIDRWGIKRFQQTASDGMDTVGAKLGRRIQRNPVVFFVISTAFLLFLAIPVLDVELGFNDAGANPETMHTRRAYDLLAQGFGPGFNNPFLIAVEGEGAIDPALLTSIEEAVRAQPGIVNVNPAVLNEAGDTAVISIIPAYATVDSRASDLVNTMRDDTLPPVMASHPENTAYVGGVAASLIDVVDVMVDRTPYFFLIVVGLSFILLAIVFRSIPIAIKAAIMNLLSISAAFGVVVAIFQWGWFGSLFGVTEGQPIIAFMPMFLFSILFGLSMDYEVFLLSRIREAWVHGKSTPDAVVEGLGVTARVITAAAAIMVVVFLSFVFTPDPISKQFGVGLAVAVLIDATIVRLILVPATMELLGEWNWWFPKWLDKIVPRINVEGTVLRAGAGRRCCGSRRLSRSW